MCGISGFYSKKNSIDLVDYYKNHKKIAHRGPDDEGFLVKLDDKIIYAYGDDTITSKKVNAHVKNLGPTKMVLGHRRLSIIDLSERGHQPLSYDNLSVVYNGEIFNYLELRKELECAGYLFDTQTDTEVFLKAYHYWGEEAFNKFNGMWAAAIYNSESDKLLLTRDRYGIKPLYYIFDDKSGSINFCSEIKGLIGFLDERKLNESSVYSYIRYTHLSHTDETFIIGINSLSPGCYLTLSNKLEIKKYYFESPTEGNLQKLLKNSVKIRTRTDTEFGLLLSGGIDSSLIAAYLSEDSDNIKSFTADFQNKKFSEKKYVELNVKKHKLDAHYINPSPNDFVQDIDDFLWTHEYPVRSLSAYSQYKIYEYIKLNTDVKVIFTGQGADEIFSGYSNDYLIYLASLLSEWNLFGFVRKVLEFRKSRQMNLKYLVTGACKYVLRQYVKRYDPYDVFTKRVNCVAEPIYPQLSLFKGNQKKSILFSSLREYFRDEDRNSMRFSVEARLPFMDYRLVEAGLALNSEQMIVNATTKAPIRDLAKGIIPSEILNRTDKMGFVSPQEIWQKNELMLIFDETFQEIKLNGITGMLDGQKIYEKYIDYKSGKFKDWAFIWRCFCLMHYCRVWGIEK